MNPNDQKPQETPAPEQPIPADQPDAPQQPTSPSSQPTTETPAPSPFSDVSDNGAENSTQPVDQSVAPVEPTPPSTNPLAPEQPQPVAPPQSPGGVQNPSKKLGVASFIVGGVGFLTGWIGIGILLGIVAVVLGILSLTKHENAKGRAITGIVLGGAAFLLGPIAFLTVLAAYNGISERAQQGASSSQTSPNITNYKVDENGNLKQN